MFVFGLYAAWAAAAWASQSLTRTCSVVLEAFHVELVIATESIHPCTSNNLIYAKRACVVHAMVHMPRARCNVTFFRGLCFAVVAVHLRPSRSIRTTLGPTTPPTLVHHPPWLRPKRAHPPHDSNFLLCCRYNFSYSAWNYEGQVT